jgi:Holliday junction DNA helicase RuvA
MIASLKGTLEALNADSAVINVGGVGFRVFMPVSTLLTLGGLGEEVRVHTHTHVREDAILLYGFAAEEDLKLFQMLTSVSGFGPKLALSMLSAMSVEQLVSAIAGGSEELLTSVPGIGKKLAGRLILELKDKIKTGWAGARVVPVGEGGGGPRGGPGGRGVRGGGGGPAGAGLLRQRSIPCGSIAATR